MKDLELPVLPQEPISLRLENNDKEMLQNTQTKTPELEKSKNELTRMVGTKQLDIQASNGRD